jgi:hypothetical protein
LTRQTLPANNLTDPIGKCGKEAAVSDQEREEGMEEEEMPADSAAAEEDRDPGDPLSGYKANPESP